MKRLLASLILVLCFATAAYSQALFQIWDAEHSAPISSTNPLQVAGVAGATSNVTLLHSAAAVSTTNPEPVVLSQGTAVLSNTNPIFAAPAGTTIANTTCTNGTVGSGAAATVTFTAASYHVKVVNTHASQILYVALTGTATNAKYPVLAGKTEDFNLAAPISSISVIGSGAGTTYGVAAY